MPRKKMDKITREEFDRRLDSHNEQMRLQLQQKEAELAQVEELLTYYEQTLDDIETRLDTQEETPSYQAVLRKRLQDLAVKTAEMAASL